MSYQIRRYDTQHPVPTWIAHLTNVAADEAIEEFRKLDSQMPEWDLMLIKQTPPYQWKPSDPVWPNEPGRD